MPRHIAVVVTLALMATGCASTVQKSDHNAVLLVEGAGGKAIVLNLTGSEAAATAKDWNDFKALWREPCVHEAAAIGDTFSIQEGAPKPTGEAGTLVVVDVADYHYVSTGARLMLGVVTGNAYINAQATFRDSRPATSGQRPTTTPPRPHGAECFPA